MNKPRVFLVYTEISDQMGTDELTKVFDNRIEADSFSETIVEKRTFVQTVQVEGGNLLDLSPLPEIAKTDILNIYNTYLKSCSELNVVCKEIIKARMKEIDDLERDIE